MKETQTGPESEFSTLLVLRLLRSLVDEEKQELQTAPPPVLPGNREGFFKGFRVDSAFGEIYQEAERLHLKLRTDDELTQLRGRLAGKIFQEMAYCFLTERVRPNTLLTAGRTLAFYSGLYLEKSRATPPFGQDSLLGISVPDGLVIDEVGSILAVCEYTLQEDEDYFENKYESFSKDKNHSPRLFTSCHFVFVSPTMVNVPPFLKTKLANGDVRFEQLPFTHKQFGYYIDGIYRINHKEATLLDLQNRVREQIKRGMRYRAGGQITPQYQRYMERFNGR